MGKESKFSKALATVIEQHGEGKTDWLGAMANDNSWSLWSLPIIIDVLEFLRPYFILLVSEDRIVITKMSFRGNVLSSQAASRTELKNFSFKKGLLSSKASMTFPDGKTCKVSFMPAKLFLGHAQAYTKALEMLEKYAK